MSALTLRAALAARILAPLLCIVSASLSLAETVSPTDTLQRANADYSQAVQLAPTDRTRSEQAIANAATAYRQVLNTPGLSAPDAARVLYNIGNAELLRGDTGRAILNYRRAQVLDPTVPGLAENLGRARARVAGQGDAGLHTDAADRTSVSVPWAFDRTRVLYIAAWFAAAFWAVLLVRALLGPDRRRPHWLWAVPPAVAVLAAVAWLSVLMKREQDASGACVVTAPAAARTSPDTLTGEAAGAAMKPGMELIAIDQRQGADGQLWARVRAREADDAQSVWIPQVAIEAVLPARPIARPAQ